MKQIIKKTQDLKVGGSFATFSLLILAILTFSFTNMGVSKAGPSDLDNVKSVRAERMDLINQALYQSLDENAHSRRDFERHDSIGRADIDNRDDGYSVKSRLRVEIGD